MGERAEVGSEWCDVDVDSDGEDNADDDGDDGGKRVCDPV